MFNYNQIHILPSRCDNSFLGCFCHHALLDTLLHHLDRTLRHLEIKWISPYTKIIPLTSKIGAGLIAGGIDATIGNPTNIAMVHMQVDGRLPAAQRRDYREF